MFTTALRGKFYDLNTVDDESEAQKILGGLAKFMSPGGGRARMGTQVHNHKSKSLYNTSCVLGMAGVLSAD